MIKVEECARIMGELKSFLGYQESFVRYSELGSALDYRRQNNVHEFTIMNGLKIGVKCCGTCIMFRDF